MVEIRIDKNRFDINLMEVNPEVRAEDIPIRVTGTSYLCKKSARTTNISQIK